jgi:small conductance mechanosensitive channel
MDFKPMIESLQTNGVSFGLNILAAFAIWIIGRMIIKGVLSLIGKGLSARSVDGTVATYVVNALSVVFNIILIMAILGRMGVETTSFAALLAGAGLAIGTAWSGLLANFAAGVFMVILRPFKVGDFVTIGGVTGTVHEIGLFVTSLDTPDNIRTFVGNNKIFSGDIQNFTANPYRRVELKAQISGAADHRQVMDVLKKAIKARVPNIKSDVGPDVEIETFTEFGPVLCVRPYCHNDHYWQVYFDTNKVIREELANFPSAARSLVVKNVS